MVYEIADLGEHSDRVSRKRQARLQHIVREALALARSEGREALTLQRLADRLDYTPGALYRYFASKEVLVAELQRAVIAGLRHRTRRSVAAADALASDLDAAPRALLAVLVTGLSFEHFARTAPVEFGLLSMYLSEPEYRLPDREAGEVFDEAWSSLADLASLLEAAADVGALTAGVAEERAVVLWAALQGAMQTRKLARSAGDRMDSPRLTRGLLRALLVGWGAEPELLDALLEKANRSRLGETAGSLEDLLSADA